MDLKEGIEKLKALLFNAEPIVTTEQSFMDEKLNDGVTVIRYDAEELATGVVVNLIDANGQVLPLPAGDYTTENGDTFTVVDDMGTIDNVVLAAEPEMMPEEGQVPAAPMPAPVAQKVENIPSTPTSNASGNNVQNLTPKRVIKSQVTEHVFSIELENEVVEVDLSAMFKKVEDENKALKEVNKQMFAVIEKFSETPVSKPTESKKKFSVSDAQREYRDSLKALEITMSKNNVQ
jgi:hypothetical protein